MKNPIYISLLFLIFSMPVLSQNNQLDEQGRKQGYWEKKYDNGNIKFKGTFKDDQPVGEFFHYDYRLNLKAKVNHLSADSARAILYHNGRAKAGEGLYVNELKEGVWVFYDRQGRISAKEEYHNGIKHGKSYTYYLNEQVSRETYFVEGLETGLRIDYNQDGKKIFEGNVIDGVFDGLITFYYPNGKPKLKGEYKNAVKEGRWIEYDENGIPKKKLDYRYGTLQKNQENTSESDTSTTPR